MEYKLHHISEAIPEPPPVDFIIEPIISASSVNLLFGPGGSKKTYTALTCLVCAALGVDFIGMTIKAPVPCLVVDEENGLARLLRRFHRIVKHYGVNQDTPLHFTTMEFMNLLEKKHMDGLGDLVRQTCSKIVLMDSLIDFSNADENKSHEMQPILHGLRKICEDTACAFLILHHTGKDPRRGARGASAIQDAVDMAIQVESKQKSPIVRFTMKKARDIECFDFSAKAIWTPDDSSGIGSFHMETMEHSPEQEKISASEAFIIKVLTEQGQLDSNMVRQLGEVAGFATGTIKNGLTRLHDLGKIERVDGGSKSLAVYRMVTVQKGVTFLHGPRAIIEE